MLMPCLAAGGATSLASPLPRLPGGESSARAGPANTAPPPSRTTAVVATRRMCWLPLPVPLLRGRDTATQADRVRRLLQDPGVLRAAVLGRVDDQRAFVAGDAREPSREHARLGALAHEDERPQVDVARGELAARDGRVRREHDQALGDPVAGRGLDLLAHRRDVLGARVRRDHHADAAVAGARLDHELLELV